MLLPSGPIDARLMIVTDCVSYRDFPSRTILSDPAFNKMLSEAGIIRSRCFITALIREEVTGQSIETQIAPNKKAITPEHEEVNGKWCRPALVKGLQRLERDIELVGPKVILALGQTAGALVGKWGLKSWRGSILPYTAPCGHECHIIPCYTPAYVQSSWTERPITIHDMRRAWSLALSNSPILPPAYDFLIEPSFSETTNCLRNLLSLAVSGPLKLSVDIETRGGHIACIGIAWSALNAICIPYLRAALDPAKTSYWLEDEEIHITHLLYRLLTHPNVEIVGQNFIYDAQYFHRHFCFTPRFARDTMLAQHTIFSNMPKKLDYLSSLHCTHHVYWKDESKNWDPKIGERQLWVYNCKDACVTYEIDDSQRRTIEALSEKWPELAEIEAFQQSLFYPVLDTMNNGLRVNDFSKQQLSAELSTAIAERNEWLEAVVGHPLNIKSPKQMADFFYRELAQKPIKNRQTGALTCNDEALERIGQREPLLLPVTKTIAELRSLNVFRSTFLEAELDHDNRMRCSFNIGGTETFRFSSSTNAFGSGMNLQTVPKGDEDAA